MQYWIKNPTIDLSKVDFAVLLDMVGGDNACFNREFYSQITSGFIYDMVWKSACKAGHSLKFKDKLGEAIIDDHVYFLLNKIPAVVIIESNHLDTGFFCPTWHTTDDTIETIDKNTLQAIGETMEQFLTSIFKSTA